MKSVKFFYGFFCLAACYQLFCNNFIKADNNTKIKKIQIVYVDTIEVDNEVIEQEETRYTLSKAGKDFIKKHETCVLDAYNDPDPKRRSVGWGHQIQPGEKLEHITQEKADELFEKDIEWVNDAINRLISKNDNRFVYSQGFVDGLGSLIYNCGERGVTLTEFYNRWQKCRYSETGKGFINESDFKYTVAAVKTSRISAPGHIQRRYNEHMLMMN